MAAARCADVPVEGICFYTVLVHPGSDDDRYCPNGLRSMEREGEGRRVDPTFARELARQASLFAGRR